MLLARLLAISINTSGFYMKQQKHNMFINEVRMIYIFWRLLDGLDKKERVAEFSHFDEYHKYVLTMLGVCLNK